MNDVDVDGFWYLGSPYSRYLAGIDAAYEDVCHERGLLVQNGVACFSPVIHSHPVARYCDMDPYDYAIWMPSEAPIMDCAKGLIVLMLDGWENSDGLKQEMRFFREKKLPIVFMTPGTVPSELLG